MIEGLLPIGVVSAEAYHDLAGAVLFAAEQVLIAGAVEKRRREFTTVRLCARQALAGLGIPPVPLLPGARGAPEWPAGVVGSMTHCAGYRACAVARQEHMTALGIDAEPDAPLPEGVLETVSLPVERHHLRELAAADGRTSWDRLLFSAKESVYKAIQPSTGQELDFTDVVISFDVSARTLSAKLIVRGLALDGRVGLTRLDGRWATGRGLLFSAVAVPTASSPALSRA